MASAEEPTCRAATTTRPHKAMKSRQSLSILLLADVPRGAANTIRDHVGAFRRYSRHSVHTVNPRGSADLTAVDFEAFDVVVIHYTIHPNLDSHVAPTLRNRLRAFRGVKVQFLQDEYRWVDAMTASMRDLGIDILYSAVPEEVIDTIYGGRLDGTRVLPTLTGYVPELTSTSSRPLERRPIALGYRGRVVPWWLGAFGQEKVEIARGVLARAPGHGLRCDIAWNEHDRLYGRRWSRFLAMCRTTLTTESGASIVDFDGSVETRTQRYLDEHPEATFAEVHAAILAPFEGNAIINTVSPRIFEAAAARSALVAFPGDYNDVIQPHEHYIPLEKDFSNFDEVAEKVRDLPKLAAMAERAHQGLVRSGRYSYEAFVHAFDEVIAEQAAERLAGAPAPARERSSRSRTRVSFGLRLPPGRLSQRRARLSLSTSVATARLVATDRELQRLVVAYFRDPDVRRSVHVSRLTKDLLRLGIVRRAHRGEYVTLRPFSIQTTVDAESKRLILTSRPKNEPCRRARPDEIHAALRSGHVNEILWNHRAIGATCLYLPAFRSEHVNVPVGYYGLNGIHEFGALKGIARRHPEVVWHLLRPLLAAGRRHRRAATASALLRLLPRPMLETVLRQLRERRQLTRLRVRHLRIRKELRRRFRKRRHRVHKHLRRVFAPTRRNLRHARNAIRGSLRHALWKVAHVLHQVRP